MTRSDRWIGGLFLVLGLLIAREAGKLEFVSSYGAGSGFFPYWLGVAIVVLGAVITALGTRSSIASLAGQLAGAEIKQKALTYGGIIGFVVGLPLLGFVTSLTLLVGFLLKLEGENWLILCAVALASGIGFYLFFIRLLAVDLPIGPLGF
jgi:Tripartite tricarboxylate transporter TctB family